VTIHTETEDGDQILRFENCPKCGVENAVVVHPWWDDAEENGGECIGEWASCVQPNCDFDEER
jgi:hypothetical protein